MNSEQKVPIQFGKVDSPFVCAPVLPDLHFICLFRFDESTCDKGKTGMKAAGAVFLGFLLPSHVSEALKDKILAIND